MHFISVSLTRFTPRLYVLEPTSLTLMADLSVPKLEPVIVRVAFSTGEAVAGLIAVIMISLES